MYEIKRKVPVHYSEIYQVNPIKWETLFRTKEYFRATSSPFKCKDFLNDVVAYYNNKQSFCMYSFKNRIRFNKEGLYLCVTEILNPEQFKENIEKAINVTLKEQLSCEIEVFLNDSKNIILLFPKQLLKNTFYISLVTMLIRCSNYGMAFSSWEDFFKSSSPLLMTETVFNKDTLTYVKKHRFYLPKDYVKYWYFAGDTYNSEGNINPHIIHDNGCSSWVRSLLNKGAF